MRGVKVTKARSQLTKLLMGLFRTIWNVNETCLPAFSRCPPEERIRLPGRPSLSGLGRRPATTVMLRADMRAEGCRGCPGPYSQDEAGYDKFRFSDITNTNN